MFTTGYEAIAVPVRQKRVVGIEVSDDLVTVPANGNRVQASVDNAVSEFKRNFEKRRKTPTLAPNRRNS